MFNGDLIDDCNTLLEFITNMKLHNANNRKNLNNGKAPKSCVYGYTKWKRYSNGKERKESALYPKWYDTKLKTDYPEMESIFKKFADYHLPNDFKYSDIVINKNFRTQKHKDASNVGLSYIIGLGDYEGGNVIVENQNNTTTFYNIKNQPVGFNGSLLYHSTEPFTGTRYSIVFYFNGQLLK